MYRNVAVSILFTFLTFGIYGLYWMVKLTDETVRVRNYPFLPSGIVCMLLAVITCGIFTIYWAYKMGEQLDYIKGFPTGTNKIIYMLLSIFGLNIIVLALGQNDINSFINVKLSYS